MILYAGVVVGNSHLGESDALRIEAIRFIKSQLTPEIPTLIQGADTLSDVSCVYIVLKVYIVLHIVDATTTTAICVYCIFLLLLLLL